jgi:flagellar hook-basal body complex protein FliE
MSIQSLDAMSAYAKVVQRPGIGGPDANAAQAKPAAGGGAFAAMVDTIVTQAVETGRTAEAASADLVRGKAELVDVVTAVNAAEMSLETLVAVRDKVIAAYQDIMRMPI